MALETLDGTHWDVLISGTGLYQSLLVLALSRSGKKILHVDKNHYYGGPEAAFSLQEAQEWAASRSSIFSDASTTQNSPFDDPSAPKLSFSRAYSLALAPQILYTRSSLLRTLVSSQVYRQLEFQAIGTWFVYAGSDGLTRVPSGREAIFQDDRLSMRSKRLLTKFLRFMLTYRDEEQRKTWMQHKEKPFPDFLNQDFGLPEELHAPLLALTMLSERPGEVKTEVALDRVFRHLSSIGVFGPGFAAVVPKWGGLAEIAQVACRAGAVGGAVYVLGRGVEVIKRTEEEVNGFKDGEIPRPVTAVLSGDGEKDAVTADWVVGSTDDLPLTTTGGTAQDAALTSISRLVAIVSSDLSPLFPVIAEGVPLPAGAVIYYPARSLDESQQHPIHIIAHSSETGECPAGQCVLYANTLCPGEEGFSLLQKAVDELLKSAKEQFDVGQADALWSMKYHQHHGSSEAGDPAATSLAGDLKDRVFTFPSPSLDLAFDDQALEEVKSMWKNVVDDAVDDTEFMRFENREGGDDEEVEE